MSVSRTWAPLFWACGAAILVLALLPTEAPIPSTGWDKSNHVLAFGVLAMLGCLAYPGRIVPVLSGSILYGGLIEVLQSFTSYRFAEWADVVADTIGVLIGHGLLALSRAAVRSWRGRRR
jgi:VanZ family protein